jgi:hypothetical protein
MVGRAQGVHGGFVDWELPESLALAQLLHSQKFKSLMTRVQSSITKLSQTSCSSMSELSRFAWFYDVFWVKRITNHTGYFRSLTERARVVNFKVMSTSLWAKQMQMGIQHIRDPLIWISQRHELIKRFQFVCSGSYPPEKDPWKTPGPPLVNLWPNHRTRGSPNTPLACLDKSIKSTTLN